MILGFKSHVRPYARYGAVLSLILVVLVTASCKKEPDTFPPEIKLVGPDTVWHQINTPFQEPGYSATDNRDGDITENVQVSGDALVDSWSDGELIYTVKDEAGLYDEKVRLVRKRFGPRDYVADYSVWVSTTNCNNPGAYATDVDFVPVGDDGVWLTPFLQGDTEPIKFRLEEDRIVVQPGQTFASLPGLTISGTGHYLTSTSQSVVVIYELKPNQGFSDFCRVVYFRQ